MIKIIKSSEVREPKIYINTFKEKQPRDKIIDDKLIFFLIFCALFHLYSHVNIR